MGIMVAGFQLEEKVCEDQDQLKMKRSCCWVEGGDVLVQDKLGGQGLRQWKLTVWKQLKVPWW